MTAKDEEHKRATRVNAVHHHHRQLLDHWEHVEIICQTTDGKGHTTIYSVETEIEDSDDDDDTDIFPKPPPKDKP